jgi:pimeloyl-ACP methyl ester carboxylesterase
MCRHRDIVFVSNWFMCCEHLPEMPSIQGWVEAMTSLGRLIFFDQPGCGVSDPVTLGALPTLEQWADSITAVLDDLGSREAVLVAADGAFAPAALFAATHPSRTTALIVLEGYASGDTRPEGRDEEALNAWVAMWGTGEYQHLLNPDMPWNESPPAGSLACGLSARSTYRGSPQRLRQIDRAGSGDRRGIRRVGDRAALQRQAAAADA